MDLTDSAARRLGTTLRNKWTLDKLLGVGGMAAVYVASHKIGRREAIKILHPEIAESAEVRARFEQEARAANRVKHPGAVEIRDIDVSEDGAPFLVMELLEGEPLSARVKRLGTLDASEVLRIADEVLDVLIAAHDVGVIHRDVKIDNLFVEASGRIKVLDFGIARVRDDNRIRAITRTGQAIGTLTYMAPEQVRGRSVDARADLFALGATMFRLLAARRIHEADSEGDLTLMMAELQAPPLASVVKTAPRELCLIVDRALQLDRERRYPDAKTMQKDVRAVRDGEPPPFATEALTRMPDVTTSTRPIPAKNAPTSAEPTKRGGSPEGDGPFLPVTVPEPTVDEEPANVVDREAPTMGGPEGGLAQQADREASTMGAPNRVDLSGGALLLTPTLPSARPVKLAHAITDEPTLQSAETEGESPSVPVAGDTLKREQGVVKLPGAVRGRPTNTPFVDIVPAPPLPPKRTSKVVGLVLYALLFAGIGVLLTLWLMSR